VLQTKPPSSLSLSLSLLHFPSQLLDRKFSERRDLPKAAEQGEEEEEKGEEKVYLAESGFLEPD
jgi:hypothetical protein